MNVCQLPPHIGTLSEGSLHADLKQWYVCPGDRLEVRVGNYVVDIVRGDLLIEIQTGNFSALRQKLSRLLESHALRLVYPIPQEKWLLRQTAGGGSDTRRKSPRRGRIEDVFYELVNIASLVGHPRLTLEILLIREEITLRNDGRGSWRRKGWSIAERHLIEVMKRHLFTSMDDYRGLLPSNLPELFTSQTLSEALGIRANLARKMTYTLHKMAILEITGKTGRKLLYRLSAG